MARVTVEDCITVVNNRYELVLLSAQRARDIAAGMQLTVDRDNDKNAVVALREIAQQSVDLDELRRHIVRGVNRHSDTTTEDDALLALTQEAFAAAGLDENKEDEAAAGSEIEEITFEDESATAEAKEEAAPEAADQASEDTEAAFESAEDIEAMAAALMSGEMSLPEEGGDDDSVAEAANG